MLKPNQKSKSSKQNQVEKMFNSISFEYDLLNAIMTFNSHKRWKKNILNIAKKIKPKNVLDIATGTADIAINLGSISDCKVVGVDISEQMLSIGREKISKNKLDEMVSLERGDAENLNFKDGYFDLVTIGFGVRNFQDLEKGLRESFRVLNKEGTLIILETSVPENRIMKLFYSIFTRTYIPIMARIFSKDKSAYKYLLNSAEAFPSGRKFSNILKSIGFGNVMVKPKLFGSSTIYIATK
ncbi:MAG: bifunctional demethylmenaquinone methyltransferase/2-methoxy-6-polyprenyl-1,4-benzoquinol methylase UbiE [Flavobacteriaceae bacterium]|nr:bifunctional demethylmenaquinone methyltransferase/2-methoxy-6-polyprenyl-1,4-benzoquinol methylase UbiE [Flavobacteriaceae bacterium]|tara:strand:+ start:322 stop:1041 length:720 start_codon:yes stop_codon:yes gene_type:complete